MIYFMIIGYFIILYRVDTIDVKIAGARQKYNISAQTD